MTRPQNLEEFTFTGKVALSQSSDVAAKVHSTRLWIIPDKSQKIPGYKPNSDHYAQVRVECEHDLADKRIQISCVHLPGYSSNPSQFDIPWARSYTVLNKKGTATHSCQINVDPSLLR